jgi:hypothetical protein
VRATKAYSCEKPHRVSSPLSVGGKGISSLCVLYLTNLTPILRLRKPERIRFFSSFNDAQYINCGIENKKLTQPSSVFFLGTRAQFQLLVYYFCEQLAKVLYKFQLKCMHVQSSSLVDFLVNLLDLYSFYEQMQ